MTKNQFKNAIINTYNEAIKRGQTIEVNNTLPYISINNNSDEYFFQGDEAENFINEYNQHIENNVLHEDITIENWLLWLSQGW
jgi:hypothetical protein